MLVLSRKKTEALVIDGDINVTVLRVAGNRVELGITAPGRRIVRQEIIDRPPTHEGEKRLN